MGTRQVTCCSSCSFSSFPLPNPLPSWKEFLPGLSVSVAADAWQSLTQLVKCGYDSLFRHPRQGHSQAHHSPFVFLKCLRSEVGCESGCLAAWPVLKGGKDKNERKLTSLPLLGEEEQPPAPHSSALGIFYLFHHHPLFLSDSCNILRIKRRWSTEVSRGDEPRRDVIQDIQSPNSQGDGCQRVSPLSGS